MHTSYWIATIFTVAICFGLVIFRGDYRQSHPTDRRILAADAIDPSVTYSNILRNDYVGPEACAECHQTQYELWKTHPHHCMNQLPDCDSVQGDFINATLSLPTGNVQFTTEASKYLMTVIKNDTVHRRYEVTRTVGSRYMQAYIGRQIEGPEAVEHEIYQEHRLPFAYWFKLKRWFPRKYLNIHGAEELSDGIPQCEGIDYTPKIQVYQKVCMNCHNTYPYVNRIFQSQLVGFRNATIAASIEPLSEALNSSGIAVAPTSDSFAKLNERLDPNHDLVTQGISCESCHLGGKEHALRAKEIRFLPTSQFTQILPKDQHHQLTNNRKDAATINGVCVQCHAGNTEMFPNGAGKGNSREALDLIGGFCASQMRCVDCHEPHTGTPYPSGFSDQPKHIDVCIKCHTQFRDKDTALSHGGHPVTADVNCLDCHMPRYTRGIDELIRTHRICMPVEPSMVEKGMANACNACHLDKPVRWTLNQLERQWGRTIKPQPNWSSYHDLDEPAGDVWLKSEDSHMRLLATQSIANSTQSNERTGDMIRALNDPESVNRVFASFSVSRLLGQPLDKPLTVDITAPPATRARQIDALIKSLAP